MASDFKIWSHEAPNLLRPFKRLKQIGFALRLQVIAVLLNCARLDLLSASNDRSKKS
jgi:hypothetical protein